MSMAFDPLSSEVIEAAIDVHRVLGPGYLESIYHKALKISLEQRNVPVEYEKEVVVLFGGSPVGIHKLDLVVSGELIVELKAVKALEDIHYAQLRSYLKATGIKVGLLMNFNALTLVVKRVVLDWKG